MKLHYITRSDKGLAVPRKRATVMRQLSHQLEIVLFRDEEVLQGRKASFGSRRDQGDSSGAINQHVKRLFLPLSTIRCPSLCRSWVDCNPGLCHVIISPKSWCFSAWCYDCLFSLMRPVRGARPQPRILMKAAQMMTFWLPDWTVHTNRPPMSLESSLIQSVPCRAKRLHPNVLFSSASSTFQAGECQPPLPRQHHQQPTASPSASSPFDWMRLDPTGRKRVILTQRVYACDNPPHLPTSHDDS